MKVKLYHLAWIVRLTYKLCLQIGSGVKGHKEGRWWAPAGNHIVYGLEQNLLGSHSFIPVTQVHGLLPIPHLTDKCRAHQVLLPSVISSPGATGHSHFQHKAVWTTLSSFYSLFPDTRWPIKLTYNQVTAMTRAVVLVSTSNTPWLPRQGRTALSQDVLAWRQWITLLVPGRVIPFGPSPGPGSLIQTVSWRHSPHSGIFWCALTNAILPWMPGRTLSNGVVAPG